MALRINGWGLILAMLAFALLSVAVTSTDNLAAAQPDRAAEGALPNVNHIFRSLISALRQFPSSINHNGVSYFFATIPAGTQLYHGRGGSAPVEEGLEWLALEPEHASNFAVEVCFPDGEPPPATTSRGPETPLKGSADSAKWWLAPDDLQTMRPGVAGNAHDSATQAETHCTCPDDEEHMPGRGPNIAISHPSSIHFHPQKRQKQQQQQPILQPSSQHPPGSNPPPRPPKHGFPRACAIPGHLHTYTPISGLHLLYIDGQSAAKSNIGTLASQDDILLRNSSFRPGKGMFGELDRAVGLCDLAENEWEGKIDGFLRMEHGFEVILCDFRKVKVENVVKKENFRGREGSDGESMLQFWRAVGEDRWWGVGRERVRLWTEKWVSAFAVDGLDLWKGSLDGKLPNLDEVTDEVAAELRREVTDMVLRRQTNDGREAYTDWQSIADLYVQRYATRLQYLISFGDAAQLANATKDVYMVYQDSGDDTPGAADNAVQRCTHAFIPARLRKAPAAEQSLSQQAITAVAHQICATLHDITHPPLSDDLALQKERLEKLMTYLRWPQWEYCNGSRGCDVNEVCFTAIWPWGGQEDHDWPRCWNASGLMTRMGGNPRDHGDGYWRQGEMRGG